MKKEACVIFSKKCDGNVVLGKVRDRMYDPSVCVYHLELDGTEICVMFDRITGFCEGINEHGIGIVNSSLMVLQDEREGISDGDQNPERSPDGIKIIKALTKKTVPETLRALIAYKPRKFQRGLKGHTLVSNGKEVYALENTRIHTPKVLRLKPHEVNTRTNHGIYYPGAGYTKGDDYISSIVRQWEAKKQLEKVQRTEDLMPALTQSIEKTDGSMNPVRFTDKMRTTSQMVVDPAKGEMLLYLVPEHSKFEGVRNLLPGGRKPKMKVRVFKYPSREKLKDPYVTVPDEMETASARKSLRRQIMAQRVAAQYRDQFPGGLADKKKPEDFDQKQLAKGIKVEREHVGDDTAKAREIAMDHLVEDPKYYDKLEAIEKHAKSRYKSKKKVKTKDGDEMTVYEYSDRQVADRNRKKAERVENLRKQMKKLQTKVRSDVNSDDEKTRDLALAVGLMDETFERIGNDGSAKEGHFGVTTWRVKHVKFSKGSATITYVGKSGVDQKKKITNSRIVSALKKACKDKKPEDRVLNVSASEVNAYLKPLDITAKDIRGFHANREMKDQLRKVRKGKLPEDKKERDKKLKDEFKKALEETAKSVGHEPSTLRSQYLVPGLEDDYMKDGTISESHTRKAADLAKVAASGTDFERKILAHARVAPTFVGQDRRWWLRNAPNIYRVARENERARPYIEGLRFPPEMFAVIWFEDSDGKNLGEPNYYADSPPEGPEGSQYMHSQFPCQLTETILKLNEDGSSEPVMEGNSTYPNDLVTAMVRSKEWDVADAVMVAGQSCSRCLNVLCNRYLGEEEGFPFDSEEYWEHGTECRMCRHIQNPNQKKATPSYEDYVQRKRREGGRPLPRDRWEALVMGGSPEEDPPSREDWNERRKSMVERHGLDKFYTGYSPDNRHLSVDLISVPKDRRGQGGATAAMKETLDWADQNGVTVTLSPTSEFGASKKRLEKWYAGMGFVPNKGRNKDFRFTDSMLRTPQTRTATKSEAERDDEAVEKMLRKEPKKKPPRYDLRDNRTLDEEEEENLGGGDKGDRDLSMKWNKVGHRVAFRWLAIPTKPSAVKLAYQHLIAEAQTQAPPSGGGGAGQEAPKFEEWVKEKRWPSKAENAPPGAEIGFEGLKKQDPEAAKKVREEYKRQFPGAGDDEGGKKEKGDEEPKQRTREDIDADLESARNDVDELEDSIEGLQDQIKEHKRNIEKLKAKRKQPKLDPEARKEKIQGRIDQEKAKMRETVSKMKPLGKEIDELEDRQEELADGIKGQKKVIKDSKKILKQIGEDHPQAAQVKEAISDARKKIREAEGDLDDVKEGLKSKKSEYKSLRSAGKDAAKTVKFLEGKLDEPQAPDDDDPKEKLKEAISDARKKIREAEGDLDDVKERLKSKKSEYKSLQSAGKDAAKTVKFLEGKLDEPQAPDEDDPKEQLKEERRKLEDAEDDLKEKKEDLKAGKQRVDDLKAERKDPTGAKRQQADAQKKERDKRVREAITKTTKSMESMMGKGSGLPRALKERVADQINGFSEDEMEQFALEFDSTLKKLVDQDPTSEDAVITANGMAKSGYSTEGLSSPEDLAERMAQIAYTRNVVANPMIAGGTPVGQTDMDESTYSARAFDGFNQFKNLNGILRREAASRIADELRGLDPETDRATELKGILAGINMAQIADTGEALPGQQQPSKGSAALIRQMVEMGHAETMLKPSEDVFSEVGRAAMRNALNNMTDEEVADFIIGDDPNQPFAQLRDLIKTPGPRGSEFKQLMKSFLIEDWMIDIWGDRAARDVMEAAGEPDWDDPEKRAQILEEAKANGGPGRQKAFDAMMRVDEARKRGERPDPNDEQLVQDMLGEGGGALVEGAKSILNTLKEKFNKFVVSPATAVLKNFTEMGDASVLETETLPHADEGSPPPRTKDEREEARAEKQREQEQAEAPQYSPKQIQRARTRLKAMRGKLRAQRKKISPDQREKFDKQLERIEGRLSDLESGKPGDLSDVGEQPDDKDHKPGEVWRTEQGNWRAKNKQGVPKSFKDKAKAEQYAGRKQDSELAEGEPEGFSADFDIPVEERGPTRFASEKVANLWLDRVRRIHPDDPNRPRIVIEAA